jgi:hypothetical protein
MKASIFRSSRLLSGMTAVAIGIASSLAHASAPTPNPCSLVTVAEMQQIVGPLSEPPRATDPSSGENTCTFTPASGPSFIDVTLHEGDLAALRNSASYKNAQALPDFGKDAFVSPNFQDYADLYAKKGNLIVRVTLPMGPKSVETAKSIARKALARM